MEMTAMEMAAIERHAREMAAIERRAGENATVLGISEREALVQGLVSAAWWADLRGDWKAYYVNMAAARYAAGQISIEEFRTILKKFATLERLGY